MSGHFVSDFPDSGSVDYSDQSTNLDETAIAELKELAGRYPQPNRYPKTKNLHPKNSPKKC